MAQNQANLRRKEREPRSASFEAYRAGEKTPEIQLTIHMVLVARRWRAFLDEKLRPINQSSARMEAMAAILNSPPLSPQVDIAKRLRIEGPTLTRMLDALEKDGLVERLPDPNDRRTKLLRLTAVGESLLEEMFSIVDIYRDRLLEGLDREQILRLNMIGDELMERLDAGLPSRLDGTQP